MYKNILRDTFASVFEEKDALFKALIIPTLLLMFFNYFGAFDVNNLYLSIPIIVLTIIINITISITTHRILLLKENSIPTWGLFKLSSREGKFFLSTFGLGFIIILVGLLIMVVVMIFESLFSNFLNTTLNAIIIICILFAILSIISRLSIVFPAISVDKNITFTDSWHYTKDYKLLCFITIIVFPALFAIALSLPYGFIIDILADKISPHMTAFYSILNVFINIFIISALIGFLVGMIASVNTAPLAATLLYFAGIFLGFGCSALTVLIQNVTDDRYRGRLNALFSLIFQLAPALGGLITGIIAQLSSTRTSLMASAILIFFLSIFFHLLFSYLNNARLNPQVENR